MTHYYYYIDTGRQIDATTKFYRVAVSSSKQGDRDYLYLLARASDCGHYFARDSADVSAFLQRIAKSLYGSSCCDAISRLNVQMVKARDLVRAFKASVSLPLSQVALSNHNDQMNALNSCYRIFSNLSRKKHVSPIGNV